MLTSGAPLSPGSQGVRTGGWKGGPWDQGPLDCLLTPETQLFFQRPPWQDAHPLPTLGVVFLSARGGGANGTESRLPHRAGKAADSQLSILICAYDYFFTQSGGGRHRCARWEKELSSRRFGKK